jgi:hypothetical protein
MIKSPVIQVITDKKTVEKAKKAAKKDKRSLSSWCLILIEKALEEGK